MEAPLIYELRKPQHVEPDKTYPAIFIMHGMGSNEQNMLPLVKGLEEQFYIFSLRGQITQSPGFAFFTIEGFGKPHREVFNHAIRQLASFIDYATGKYPLDNKNLYLLGFSQGAIASMALGLTLGNRVKGIAALSGYIPAFLKENSPINPVNQLSLYISHGKYDNILPYEWGEESYKHFKELGAQVTFKSYPEAHTVSLENQLDFMSWILEDLNRS